MMHAGWSERRACELVGIGRSTFRYGDAGCDLVGVAEDEGTAM
jgi:hypothetical protein